MRCAPDAPGVSVDIGCRSKLLLCLPWLNGRSPTCVSPQLLLSASCWLCVSPTCLRASVNWPQLFHLGPLHACFLLSQRGASPYLSMTNSSYSDRLFLNRRHQLIRSWLFNVTSSKYIPILRLLLPWEIMWLMKHLTHGEEPRTSSPCHPVSEQALPLPSYPLSPNSGGR